MEHVTRLEMDGTVVLRVSGDLDIAAAEEFREAGLRALGIVEDDGTLCLDMAGVTFIDSTGINALVAIYKQTKACNRHLILQNCPRRVFRVLTLSGLHEVFTLAG